MLTESQCNGPAHLMETIATTSALDSGRPSKYEFHLRSQFSFVVECLIYIFERSAINGEIVTLEQPVAIPCRDRAVPAEEVYSYQKYNDQENI